MSTVHEATTHQPFTQEVSFIETDTESIELRAQFLITIDQASADELVSQLISIVRCRWERHSVESLLGIDHSHGGHTEIFGWILAEKDCHPPAMLLRLVSDISAACSNATVRLYFKPREQHPRHARGLIALRGGRNIPDSWLPGCCHSWASRSDQLEVFGMTTLPLIQSQREGDFCRSKNLLGITASIVSPDVSRAAARFGDLVLQLFNSGQLDEASYWLMGKESVHRYAPKT